MRRRQRWAISAKLASENILARVEMIYGHDSTFIFSITLCRDDKLSGLWAKEWALADSTTCVKHCNDF